MERNKILRISGYTKVLVFFTFSFIILISANDAYAKTFDVVIPEGSSNPSSSYHFLPSDLTVSVNDKIRWINFDANTHTVTSGSFRGGPDGIFNSGLIEKDDVFAYIVDPTDIGTFSYYCTLHPWMNGIITVLDPDEMAVARVVEAGSIEAAQEHIGTAKEFEETAKEYANTGYENQAAVSFIQSAINYHDAALEYSLLKDHEKAAKNHQEAANQYNIAALNFEIWGDFTQAVIQHFQSSVHHHYAGISYEMMGDNESSRKQFSESILQKRMSKFGSDYVMPPKQQVKWLENPSKIVCREGLEIIFKSTTKEPFCVKPETAGKLIERGWGINPSSQKSQTTSYVEMVNGVQIVTIHANEFKFIPSDLQINKGKTKFVLINDGVGEHELVVYEASKKAIIEKAEMEEDEETIEKNILFEIEEVHGGESDETEVMDLKEGSFIIGCHVPGHYEAGMKGTIEIK